MLHAVDLRIARGETVALLGRNGLGKITPAKPAANVREGGDRGRTCERVLATFPRLA